MKGDVIFSKEQIKGGWNIDEFKKELNFWTTLINPCKSYIQIKKKIEDDEKIIRTEQTILKNLEDVKSAISLAKSKKQKLTSQYPEDKEKFEKELKKIEQAKNTMEQKKEEMEQLKEQMILPSTELLDSTLVKKFVITANPETIYDKYKEWLQDKNKLKFFHLTKLEKAKEDFIDYFELDGDNLKIIIQNDKLEADETLKFIWQIKFINDIIIDLKQSLEKLKEYKAQDDQKENNKNANSKLENVFYFFMVTIVLEDSNCLIGRKFDNLTTDEEKALKFPDNFLNLQYIEENLTPKEFTIPHLFDNILPVYNAYCEVAKERVIDKTNSLKKYLDNFVEYAANNFFKYYFEQKNDFTPEQKVVKDVAERTANLFGIKSVNEARSLIAFKQKILAFFYKLMLIKDNNNKGSNVSEIINQTSNKTSFTEGKEIENYYILHQNPSKHATWVSIRNVK